MGLNVAVCIRSGGGTRTVGLTWSPCAVIRSRKQSMSRGPSPSPYRSAIAASSSPDGRDGHGSLLTAWQSLHPSAAITPGRCAWRAAGRLIRAVR